MVTDEQCRNALREFIAKNCPVDGNILGVIKSIDEQEGTCVIYNPENEEVTHEVLLRPVNNGKEALTIIPKIGSVVLCEKIDDSGYWVITSVVEAERVRIKVGHSLIELGSSGVKIENGESLGGVLGDLITAIQSITVNVTAVGSPTGVPINNPDFVALAARLNQVIL